jgi:hypothetical protein
MASNLFQEFGRIAHGIAFPGHWPGAKMIAAPSGLEATEPGPGGAVHNSPGPMPRESITEPSNGQATEPF